jgi:hypothetical protein
MSGADYPDKVVKKAIDPDMAKVLGQAADLIRDARNLSKKVSAKEAADLGKLLEKAHSLVAGILTEYGSITKKLD